MTGHVIRYRRRPSRTLLVAAVLILAAGMAVAMYWRAPARRFLPESPRIAARALAASAMLSGCFLIGATAHLWFPHLRHRSR